MLRSTLLLVASIISQQSSTRASNVYWVIVMPTQSILIVDDEPNQRLMLEQALQSPTNWTIVTVADGRAALDVIVRRPPDLIITDYHMDVMNGLDLITQVRALGIASRIILMTAYSSPDLFDAAQGLRVDHYLTKPVPLALLRSLTADVMRAALPSNVCDL
jgi:CheY-like chemotaxis protein